MVLPEGACDCHTHVIGDAHRYPMADDRQYTPGPVSAADLQTHLQRLGLQRVVIVQPSVYGTDNRCMLQTLALFEGRARGVAVVDQKIDAEELSRLHDAGVRGLRVNHESSGTNDAAGLVDSLSGWAEKLKALPWHLQVYANLDTIAAAAPRLADLGLPLVLDHFAMTPANIPSDDPRLQRLLHLLSTGTTYIKLSGAYRIGGTESEVRRLARLFIHTRPDRILWASDWPHTNREIGREAQQVSAFRFVPSTLLESQLVSWAPDQRTQSMLLVENPACLYGFA